MEDNDLLTNSQDSTEYLSGPKQWTYKHIMHATYLAVTTRQTEHRKDCHSVKYQI
jgi:hypothetical protein